MAKEHLAIQPLTTITPSTDQTEALMTMVRAASQLIIRTLEQLPDDGGEFVTIRHMGGVDDFHFSMRFSRGVVSIVGEIENAAGSIPLFSIKLPATTPEMGH